MKVFWTELANKTFEDEIAFILLKWNDKEAENFIDLVDEFQKLLSANPYIGKTSEKGTSKNVCFV